MLTQPLDLSALTDKVPAIPFVTTPCALSGFLIVRAACVYDGKTYLSWRHSTALLFFKANGWRLTQECQGFIDQYGHWWDRAKAGRIAFRAGQIARSAYLLLSEMVWDDNGVPWPKRAA